MQAWGYKARNAPSTAEIALAPSSGMRASASELRERHRRLQSGGGEAAGEVEAQVAEAAKNASSTFLPKIARGRACCREGDPQLACMNIAVSQLIAKGWPAWQVFSTSHG